MLQLFTVLELHVPEGGATIEILGRGSHSSTSTNQGRSRDLNARQLEEHVSKYSLVRTVCSSQPSHLLGYWSFIIALDRCPASNESIAAAAAAAKQQQVKSGPSRDRVRAVVCRTIITSQPIVLRPQLSHKKHLRPVVYTEHPGRLLQQGLDASSSPCS